MEAVYTITPQWHYYLPHYATSMSEDNRSDSRPWETLKPHVYFLFFYLAQPPPPAGGPGPPHSQGF